MCFSDSFSVFQWQQIQIYKKSHQGKSKACDSPLNDKWHSDGSWLKFPWIERERDFTLQHLRETWNLRMTILLNYYDFEWKTSQLSAWFHVKLLILRESVVNGNFWPRIDVTPDSVKCWKLLLSVNFPWIWIHWPITSNNQSVESTLLNTHETDYILPRRFS